MTLSKFFALCLLGGLLWLALFLGLGVALALARRAAAAPAPGAHSLRGSVQLVRRGAELTCR